MDVHCTTCGEPWDTYHLRHDAVHETDLPELLKQGFNGQLTPTYRAAFKRDGWDFGSTVMNVFRCPSCKAKEPLPQAERTERAMMKSAVEEVMGDDQDGIASTFEDFNL